VRKILALIAIAVVIGIIILADRGLAVQYFGAFYNFPGGDTVAHFLILGTLTFIVTWAFPQTKSFGSWQVPLAPLIILTLISIEELSQGFIPGRTLSLTDWLANFSGIVVGGLTGWKMAQNDKRISP
jgi:VanZ family protein